MAEMGFIGRTHELEILEGEYRRRKSFVLITGRRRVGKTRLITEFIKDKDALYFYCNKVNSRSILDEFSEAVSGYSGRPYGDFRGWKDAFEAFSSCKGGKKILIIDEFQNMIYADKDVIAYMQDAWDNMFSKQDMMLVLCGSHISVMESLTNDYNSPLYGRFTRHLKVSQLPFDDVKDDDFIGSLERYAIHGGVPKYMEVMVEADLERSVMNDVMDPSSIMFDDVLFALNDELRDPSGYMSIMRSIAKGNHKISDIASNLQVPVTSLTKPLERLMEMRLVRREVPATDDPDSSKTSLYVFDDNYSSFIFKFVTPFRSSLEIGEKEGAVEYWRKHFSEHHVAFVFEEVCRRSVYRMTDDIGFIPRRVGRYWDKHCEIDVMALDTDGKKAFVGECKYHCSQPMDSRDLNALIAKVVNVKELKDCEIKYGLFSVTGFTDDLYGKDTILIDKGNRVPNP